LRKDQPCDWNDECQQAFDKIKEYLRNPPVLMPPIPNRPLLLYVTVQEESMGALLAQHDETGKKERAIYYLSKKFNDCEVRYSAIEKTCCAVAWVAQRLRHYLQSHTTWLISKMDPIKYIFEKPYLSSRIARWQALLSQYDIVYMSQKAIKGSVIADMLADQPIDNYEPASLDFPDEDILAMLREDGDKNIDDEMWIMRFDGASNSIGKGIGAILISPDGKHYPVAAKLKFKCTNNIAEYEACTMGIKMALDMKVKRLLVCGDSSLIIHQMQNEWNTRDPKLTPYHDYLGPLIEKFEEIQFEHVPREKNQIADALATLAAMMTLNDDDGVEHVKIHYQDAPAYCTAIDEEPDGKPWYHDILVYIKCQEYPPHATESDKKTIRRLSAGYFLSGDILYKRSFDGMLMRCLNEKEARKVIEEVHEGSCGSHSSGHNMAKKILRMGYYWLKMETDCIDYVRKCHKCQVYADRIHLPANHLNVFAPTWPFSMWGIDMIGPISPKASNGHRFILVAIDYFTKWIEAASYVNVTQNVVTRFMKNNIICRYGLPERIITDNGSNLNNKMVDKLCDQFKIHHHNSVPYRPQMNGAVEAANKNIKKIIQRMTITYKDWHEMLPYALFAYRITARVSTGATPYSLVYGAEAVIPIEVEIPSLRVLVETEQTEEDWVQSRYDQLNLIDEKRLAALCHGHAYQRRISRAFDKKVKDRDIREGDLVVKQINPMAHDSRGKWAPNYEGPYVVKRLFSGGALVLAEMDNPNCQIIVNSDSVKKYYV